MSQSIKESLASIEAENLFSLNLAGELVCDRRVIEARYPNINPFVLKAVVFDCIDCDTGEIEWPAVVEDYLDRVHVSSAG